MKKVIIDNVEEDKFIKFLQIYEECPKCGNNKIFHFRLDSDWASGAGDYDAVNVNGEDGGKNIYTKEELEYDSYDRPDIDIFYCRACGHLFE